LAAMRATRDRLVLPFRGFTVEPGPGGPAVVPNLLNWSLLGTRLHSGFAGLPEYRDDHNRRTNYKVDATYESDTGDSVKVDTFSLAAAEVTRGGALRADDLPTAARRAWGGQSEDTTWIDFRGGPGNIRTVSALDVINGRVAAGAFADKVVVIGVMRRGGADVQRTPLDGGRGMAGPELQANAIDTIVRGAPLRDVSRLVDILLIVVLACVPALVGLRASRLAVPATIVVLAAVFLIVAQLAFNGGWIVPVVVPLAALAASALTLAVVVAARLVRRRRMLRARGEPDDSLLPV
jgi:CHASE2 domain-containing sensor protein